MAEDAVHDSGDSFEADTPIGKVKVSGQTTTAWVAAMSALGLVLWLGWQHHDRMAADHREVKESLSEMIYVLSLSPEDRARLRIDMPESLRRKTKLGRQRDSE
jgi:hypothetical protein